LADGYSYADWVVGTREIRDVEAGFPAPGTSLHYTVGRGPLRHTGHTKVTSVEPGECLELEVRAWPAAAIYILLKVLKRDDESSEVTIVEYPHRGLGAVLHNPVSDLLLKLRNVETLRRLERVALLHGGRVRTRQDN
jgi:hypothetical protein